jgi:outer membrane biosynthesis protein TonB
MDMKKANLQEESGKNLKSREAKTSLPGNGGFGANVEFVVDPSRYKKRLGENVDRRFASIFFITFFFHAILAYYVSSIPFEMSLETMKKFQEHYANFIYEKEPESALVTKIKPKKEDKDDSDPTGGTVEEEEEKNTPEEKLAEAPGLETPAVEARARREAYTRSTADIAAAASSKGLLALLSGTGSAAQGEGVVDLLGESGNGASSNLDKVLSEIDGIKSAGSASEIKSAGARGSRITDHGGDIGVAALTEARSSNFGKKSGSLVFTNSDAEAEEGRTAGRLPEDVMKVINSHRSAIEYCYQRALRRDPNLKGKVSIRFVIRPDGSISDAKVFASTLNNPSVEKCIISKMRSWRDFGPIDPSRGDAVFRQDYIFGY